MSVSWSICPRNYSSTVGPISIKLYMHSATIRSARLILCGPPLRDPQVGCQLDAKKIDTNRKHTRETKKDSEGECKDKEEREHNLMQQQLSVHPSQHLGIKISQLRDSWMWACQEGNEEQTLQNISDANRMGYDRYLYTVNPAYFVRERSHMLAIKILSYA